MLAPHVRVSRHLYRGEPWHVVQDPVTNQFFRLNPVTYHFVGLLDGKRTVDDAWRLTLDRFGDDAPTQNETIGLLAQLNSSNLLRVDLPSDARSLLARRRERRGRFWRGQASSILFLRTPLVNPDRFLAWLLPVFRPLLSKAGLILWAAWVGFALFQFLPHTERFARNMDSVLAPANWGFLVLLFLLTKTVHELGHGILCKRFGGAVPQMGALMLVLFPAPFVDATSSWSFPQKWQRLVVAAGGMIFELAVAAAAALVWLYERDHHPGSILQQLAFNTVFIASITTIIFNGNPLLRFDGYYMLSDLLEIPNLYDRASKQLQWLVQRFAYGLKDLPPIASTRREQAVLTLYGIGSQVYRFLVLFGIFLFIIGQFPVVGVGLAAWCLGAWMLVPLAKFVRWLAGSPALTDHRGRAVAVTCTAVLALAIIVGIVPVRERFPAAGIVESEQRSEIAMQTEGLLVEALAMPQQRVREGDILFVARNPDLAAQLTYERAELDRMTLDFNLAVSKQPQAVERMRERLAYQRKRLAELERLNDELIVRSPHDGTVIDVERAAVPGTFVPRGQYLATVADLEHLRVTALIDQSHRAQRINADTQVRLRTAGLADRELHSRVIARFDAARYELPHPALGHHGGGDIALDPEDNKGQMMLRPRFECHLTLPGVADEQGRLHYPLPGERVYVRFALSDRRSYLSIWLRRLHQVIREHMAV